MRSCDNAIKKKKNSMQYIVYTAQYPVCSKLVFHSKHSHGLRDESCSDTQSHLSFAPREREGNEPLIPRGTTTSALQQANITAIKAFKEHKHKRATIFTLPWREEGRFILMLGLRIGTWPWSVKVFMAQTLCRTLDDITSKQTLLSGLAQVIYISH